MWLTICKDAEVKYSVMGRTPGLSIANKHLIRPQLYSELWIEVRIQLIAS